MPKQQTEKETVNNKVKPKRIPKSSYCYSGCSISLTKMQRSYEQNELFGTGEKV